MEIKSAGKKKREFTREGSWHHPFIDFFRKRMPFDSALRPYAKIIAEDGRALLRCFLPWHHLEDKIPSCLFVETTNICNANCIFCAYRYQESFRAGKGIMPDAVFEKAVKEFCKMGGRTIAFSALLGEPLVDPGLVNRIRYAKDAGSSVWFYTNGIKLGEIDIEGLVRSGVDDIGISTSPFDRQIHERIFRSGKYGLLLSGAKKLLEARNSLNSALRIWLLFRSDIPWKEAIRLPDYRNEILPLLREEEKKSVYGQVKCFDSWCGLIKQGDLTGIMRLARPPFLKSRPCLWTFMSTILWDGKVRACPCRFAGSEAIKGDDLYLGDLNNDSLQSIWRGARLRALRRRFTENNLPAACRSCSMYRCC